MGKVDKKTCCHNCGKKINRFMTKIVRRCFCYYCMDYVCSKGCLSDETFIIPRNFNLEYDLKKRPVCQAASMHLNRKNYLKISHAHPQIALHDQLYNFMIRRRRLHKMFDLIKCDSWISIMEKNGHASEKNLILKDCYISIAQLSDFSTGYLEKRIIDIEATLINHLHKCHVCSIEKLIC